MSLLFHNIDRQLKGFEIPLIIVFELFAYTVPPPIISGMIVGKIGRHASYRDIEKRTGRRNPQRQSSFTACRVSRARR